MTVRRSVGTATGSRRRLIAASTRFVAVIPHKILATFSPASLLSTSVVAVRRSVGTATRTWWGTWRIRGGTSGTVAIGNSNIKRTSVFRSQGFENLATQIDVLVSFFEYTCTNQDLVRDRRIGQRFVGDQRDMRQTTEW